jgi:carbamate kinase
MRIVAALGGNALLRRNEPPGAEAQRRNVRTAVAALSRMVDSNELLISHGNGPQVGLLALERGLGSPAGSYPLDVLDAETEGMIGYLIQQEMGNVLPRDRSCAALITQIEVDPRDPAFAHPTKPIGPVYVAAKARELADARGWTLVPDGEGFRRAVASPQPRHIVEIEIIRRLMAMGVVVVCAGGGGIPVVRQESSTLIGVEAVIDKDLASALLATEVGAHALLLLTDVDAVYENWGGTDARAIRRIGVDALRRYEFAAGSMAPKVAAACNYVEQSGCMAAIGNLGDAPALLEGGAGTQVVPQAGVTAWWPRQA